MPGQKPAAPGEPGGRVRRAARRVAPDLSPLRRAPEFRRLYAAQAASTAGSMITFVALPYQAYQLTRSSLVVGLLSFAELVPLVAAALLGGVLADAADRRRLILAAEAVGLAAAVALAANAAVWHQVWLLFVLAVAGTLAFGLQRPSLDALGAGAGRPRRPAGRGCADRSGRQRRADPRAAARRHPDRRRRPARRLPGRRGQLPGWAGTVRRTAVLPAGGRRGPAEPARHRRGPALRAQPARDPRHLPDRHRRDVLRRAVRAVPGVRGPDRRGGRAGPPVRGTRRGSAA